MANRSTPRPPSLGPPSLATLFLSFLSIGSTSFGGGLMGWIRRELVERRGWIDDQQFLVCYGLSQMVPGATNVNLSVIIGTQLRGIPGALAAVAGLLLVPLAILLTAGHALLRDAWRVRRPPAQRRAGGGRRRRDRLQHRDRAPARLATTSAASDRR